MECREQTEFASVTSTVEASYIVPLLHVIEYTIILTALFKKKFVYKIESKIRQEKVMNRILEIRATTK